MAKEIEESTTENSAKSGFITDFDDSSDYSTHFVSRDKAIAARFWVEDAWEPFGIIIRYFSDATGCGPNITRVRQSHLGRYQIETQPISRLISKIRAALSLNITELAAVLKVERPTIYAWQDQRAVPVAHNLRRLQTVARIADQWSERCLSPLGGLVRTPAGDGNSIIDLLSARAIDELEIAARLQELALVEKRRMKQASDVENYMERKGLDPNRFRSRKNVIDRLTGKRSGLEPKD